MVHFFPLVIVFPRTPGHMQLTLLIPELIWPEPESADALAGLACPALCSLLARGDFTRRPKQAHEDLLLALLGQPAGAPHASFRLLGETAPESGANAASGNWLCADPVHLHFRQERLILAEASRLDIRREEAGQLVATLNEHLGETGHFHVADADRWYLRLAAPPPPSLAATPSLSSVAGRGIERMLPETPDAKGLRRLLNEAQMLLHAHPINRRREESGRMTINSLWLWGAGSLPAKVECPTDGIRSSNPLACGVARAARMTVAPAPPTASALFENAERGSRQFVVLEDLQQPVHYQDASAYRTAVNDLETRWFVPLRAALFSGKVERLRIATATAYGALFWTTGRGGLWKLWRKPQALAALAGNLAAID